VLEEILLFFSRLHISAIALVGEVLYMGLTKKEREILREPIRHVIRADKFTWRDLKYETQHEGIQQYFPY
jgi:hypothetical protein